MGARPFLLRVRAVTPWFLLHCVWKACSSREGVVHRYVRDAHAQTSGSEVVGSLRITGFFFFGAPNLRVYFLVELIPSYKAPGPTQNYCFVVL